MIECENRKETEKKKTTLKFKSQDTFCQKCDPLPSKWKHLKRYQSEQQ